jgi:hypothetical protein
VELTKYTIIDNNNNRLLALQTSGDAAWHNAEERMLWHRSLVHVSRKALEILPKVIANTLKMTRKCDCKSCIKCKLVRKLLTPTTSRATEPRHLVH